MLTVIILLVVADVILAWSMMKVASITDKQDEQWAIEHMNDKS